VDALLRGDATRFALRTSGVPALVSRCTKRSDGGRVVGLVGARHVDPLLERLARTLDVTVAPSWPRPSASAGATSRSGATPPRASGDAPAAPGGELARATCRLADDAQVGLSFDVRKSTRELDESLHDVDQTVGLYAAISAAVAFLVAIFLARSLSRPLSVLAKEAGKVAAGEARPLEVRGSGEVQELASAFDRMLQDLAVTRRRLAAASRVAAWREVARRVAHEVKNPLMPIRAAVETLRRLRARDDPRFDEYFDEATRTVLDEVHRIASIVTEFTRFARLPPPRPQEVDVEEIARQVIQIHKPAAGDVPLAFVAQRRAPVLRADRDQVIQILTNLVQNALEAVKDVPGGAVTVSTDTDGHYAAFSVVDNGPGIAPEIAARLFEPYATTKASGTGLGLAIAQRIALEHNGELSYIGPSASGKGAVFRLLLPLEGPPAMSEVPPSD
jgi:nitrogen fixation/metabolism regulation signal transduction histidine kinase